MKRFIAYVHYIHRCCLALGPSPILSVIHVVTIDMVDTYYAKQ